MFKVMCLIAAILAVLGPSLLLLDWERAKNNKKSIFFERSDKK